MSDCGCKMDVDDRDFWITNRECRYPALFEAAEKILQWWDKDAVGQLNVYAVLYPMFEQLRKAASHEP